MKANLQKTRVMRIGWKQDGHNVEVNGQKVEQVEVTKYLGAMISSDGNMDIEVEQRIGMASKMIWGDWENSAGKEGTGKGYKCVSGQCYGDTHLDT